MPTRPNHRSAGSAFTQHGLCAALATASSSSSRRFHPRALITVQSLLFVGCLLNIPATQYVSQGHISSDNSTCCHTQNLQKKTTTFYLTQPQYTDIGPTSPSVDPIMPNAWHGKNLSTNFEVTGIWKKKNSWRKREWNLGLPLLRQTSYP